MLFNPHSNLRDQHAFLSASKHSWVNYTEEKLDASFFAAMQARKGTQLHQFAHDAIKLGIRLPETPLTMNQYVNDGIGFHMTPEQILYYSDNAFGTADCIAFRNNKLRIHDLKTGIWKTSITQLEVYAALFCLEYKFKPVDIEIELRIYQSNEIKIFEGDYDVITHIMDKLVSFDRRINELRLEAL